MEPRDLQIREASPDERAWADRMYESIGFATTAATDPQLVAERDGALIGLGRLVDVGDGAVELGGIWTAESARGGGAAAAMVRALLERAREAPDVWCVPFRALVEYYARFDFVETASSVDIPFPPGIVRKADICAAHGQDVAVMRLHRRMI